MAVSGTVRPLPVLPAEAAGASVERERPRGTDRPPARRVPVPFTAPARASAPLLVQLIAQGQKGAPAPAKATAARAPAVSDRTRRHGAAAGSYRRTDEAVRAFAAARANVLFAPDGSVVFGADRVDMLA